ncbi:MAG TPA: DNA methyltransferase [Acidimicrobiales bacterium]|nr:DNA methyltransferase [Acidimicrobiales bacterium]
MSDQLFGSDESAGWDIAAARAELADRLDGIRDRPGFPLGDDEAIVNLSLPPYHTACPNPFLADWLGDTSGNDIEREDPGPFVTDITEGKGNAFYKAHSYPTKVPYPAIMRFLLHYTKPGDVVLDGFAGSGSTGIAAQACGKPDARIRRAIEEEMGMVPWGYRRAVLSDLSPSASVIAAGINLPLDGDAFDKASAEVLSRFDAELGWMYETTHSNGKSARIEYTVWSEVFTCPECGSAVVFYDVAYNPKTGRVEEPFRCPAAGCGAELDKDHLERRLTTVRTPVGDTAERIELRPVRIHYVVGKDRFDKSPDQADLDVISRVSRQALAGPVPSQDLPLDAMYHGTRLGPKGFMKIHHLWGDRSLHSLAWLWKTCHDESDPLVRYALIFWVEQAFWGLSYMNRYQPIQQGKLGGSQVNRQMTGVYYVGSLQSECAVRYNLEGSKPSMGKRQTLVKTWKTSPARLGQVVMSTGSSTSLDLPNASIDYLFVDPPFGANIPYSDLAYLIEAWHGVYSRASDEAIENRSKKVPRSLAEYGELMSACFVEFYRVLKPGRWMTVEFSNHSNEVWLTVQRALELAGFMVADTRILDKTQLSYRQVTADSAAKKDLVISCYKPAVSTPSEGLSGDGDPETAWSFTREHLSHLPITDGRRGEARPVRERMADRLYDRMIAFHVSRKIPVPVTTTEFFAGIDQRFPLRDGMYFLDPQVESYDRHRITIKELLEDTLFITGESSAVQWLRQLLKARGRPQPYSEIMPRFLTELANGLSDWEELPELRLLLEQNFVQDDEGRWYVPDPRKATDLEKLRRRALLKEFAAYQSSTGKLTRFRTEAVRAGFDDAWDRREFALIVKVGRRLPAEVLVEDQALRYFLDNAELLVG